MYTWMEDPMAFYLRKFLTSVCCLSKIAFVCCINNISPLKDSSCIPSKSCFVFNATPSSVGHADIPSISSSSVSLFFFLLCIYVRMRLHPILLQNHLSHVILKINTKPPTPHVECNSKFHNILI